MYYYLVTILFMLVGAQANFIASQEYFYYIIDIIIIMVGLELKRFTEFDLKVIARFGAAYIGFMTLRFLFLTHLGTYYYISDIHFLVKQIFLSFLFCAVLKEKAVYYMVRVIYVGVVISLVFYALQLVSGNLVYGIGAAIGLPPRSFGNTDYTNFLIFSFDKGHPHQNAGFTWEPGAYGCFLNVTLLMYMLLNKFTFDKKIVVFIVAIITTLSTTSYIALMFNLLLYYRVNGGKFDKFILFGVPVFGVLFLKLPFLIDKIGITYASDLEVLEQIKYLDGFYKKNGGTLPLNRFGSVIYLYNLFGYRLIWGVSNAYQGVNPTLANINISNGDIDFITKFGMVGFVYLIYTYIQFLKNFLFRNEYIIYCVLIIILLAFGEPLLIFQITLTFFFLYHYVKPEIMPLMQVNEDGEEEELDSYHYINTP